MPHQVAVGTTPTRLWDLDFGLWAAGEAVSLLSEGASRPWTCRDPEHPLLVVLPDSRQAKEFSSDWKGLFGRAPFLLEELPLLPEKILQQAMWVRRGEMLRQWYRSGGVLVATPGALVAPFLLAETFFALAVGEEVGRDRFIRWLSEAGYERVDMVWAPGQFVARGGIVDLFDPGLRHPLRVEFFDETVESMRAFSPESQRSLYNLEEVELCSLTGEKEHSLLDFLAEDTHIVIFDPDSVESQADSFLWLWENLREEARSLPGLSSWQEFFLSLAHFPRLRVLAAAGKGVRLPVSSLPTFHGRFEEVEGFLKLWKEQGYEVCLYSKNEELKEWHLARGVECRAAEISCGFIDRAVGKVFLAGSALGDIYLAPQEEAIRPPADWDEVLSIGQWVVHEDYGVAQFLGTQPVEVDGGPQEFLKLEFAEGKRLLVPAFQLYKISPYVSPSGSEASPDHLDRKTWKRSLESAKRRAEEAARELVELYAKREGLKGYAFPLDGELLARFERTFSYDETPDQLRAIEAIKRDMESPLPMDRLVVGDVGYGKTEIAMRAAFKAVEGGRQVAILVPTTLLAQQHYATFKSRLVGFPVSVEVLSRFVPQRRQAQILRDAEEGKVDILIGTHRLLQRDVRFKDLGLVIIDEEHRFGVKHKEYLKKMKSQVDVLAISATPIPRTLHMALSGLRDISVIATPPKNRRPVITVVSPWRDELVKKAIVREIARGGQVIFIHNRVQSIKECAARLRALLPSARIGIAHGQMEEGRLDKVMVDFLDGKLDVLVCTTIVESGLDIARANTLIVDDARRFGLAQLYQLRGRVGRRDEQAFAYFLYPAEHPLSRETQERLEAIAEFTELGSGYQLSLRDLQIRGGGEILGLSQHGHGDKVGLYLYYKLLEEAILKARGEAAQKVALVEVKLPLGIPPSYIPQDSVRVALYRRLLKADSGPEVDELAREIGDRFGPPPEAVRLLLACARLRAQLHLVGVEYARCTWDETLVTGEAEGLKSLVSGLTGWVVQGSKAIGPGGPRAVVALASRLEVLSAEGVPGR